LHSHGGTPVSEDSGALVLLVDWLSLLVGSSPAVPDSAVVEPAFVSELSRDVIVVASDAE